MLAIGGAAGAASFTHVHNLAAAHGQPGWLAWADAIVLELMSIASGLELRRRKRAHVSTVFPAVVLGCAVILSLAAQVVEAEPSPIGWSAAAVPALGFLVMVKVALGHTATATRPARTTTTRSTADHPDRAARPSPTRSAPPTPDPLTRPRTVHPAGADREPAGPDRRPRVSGRGPSTLDVDELLPVARHARDRLAADGRALTRGALAEALRSSGHTVSNTRASHLLKILKSETLAPSATTAAPRPPAPSSHFERSGDPTP